STRAARRDAPPGVAEEDATSGEPELAEVVADEPLADPRVIPALRGLWGFDALRPGQSAVINRAMAGRDTLAVMPTGAGKSLTFQLPAMLLDGPTLVISPLIALMKDQVEAMPPAVRERTAVLNSSLAPDEQRRLLDGIAAGDYAMVYAAPERLRQHAFVRALRAGGVARVVVDEAHCISLWGHDFRPDYLSIPAVLPSLGEPPVLAITATATREMERGIADRFGRDLELVRSSMFRPNLRYEVETVADRPAKIDRIVALCREEPGSGIVYVSSRRDAETIADLLRRARVQAVAYHAGMDPGTRSRNQDAFMSGRTRIVVATVAFGMGVDKADVRLIVHAAPPGSLEA
ncbi:MAG TPA: RecQ family ATP-dependent DNA helicase, partial [Thermomicrobiales bacterium]|nr:RecQ family ATP-dependent DNA helicase [Thermomicrobiales bacterium]